MRRALVALFCGSLLVLMWASTAGAQVEPQYPAAPTTGPGAVEAVRAPGALPRTGSSNTPSLVLIGVTALVVGLVLVLAVWRRRSVARGIA